MSRRAGRNGKLAVHRRKVVNDFATNLGKYHGSKHVIPCANGTDALQIAMMALGLQPGDEVITPSFTYIATVEVAALLHIKPIFVEVDKRTFCIDPEVLENAIPPKQRPSYRYTCMAMQPIWKPLWPSQKSITYL